MAAFRLVVLECDMLDCDLHMNFDTDDIGEARRLAAARGWEYDRDADEDICADHEVKL